jgi:hypothetical protein
MYPLPKLSIAVVVPGAEVCPVFPVIPTAPAAPDAVVIPNPTARSTAFAVELEFHSNGPPVAAAVEKATIPVTIACARKIFRRDACSK